MDVLEEQEEDGLRYVQGAENSGMKLKFRWICSLFSWAL